MWPCTKLVLFLCILLHIFDFPLVKRWRIALYILKITWQWPDEKVVCLFIKKKHESSLIGRNIERSITQVFLHRSLDLLAQLIKCYMLIMARVVWPFKFFDREGCQHYITFNTDKIKRPGASLESQEIRLHLPVQDEQVWSLVEEPRSHLLCGMAKK